MSFQPLRERDASGNLLAAGYEWEEDKDNPGLPLYLLTCAGVVAALLGVWVALFGDAAIGLAMIAGGAVGAWLSYRAMRTHGHNKGALVFRADDTVVALSGPLPVKVSDISNVEYRLRFDTPCIVLATRHGRKIDVVGNRGLEDDEGRRIHKQLVQALREIRQARARLPLPPRTVAPSVDCD